MKTAKIKSGKTIFFWYSAGHVLGVTFCKFVKTKRNTGREDTNEIGVGVKYKSDLIGDDVIRPYTEIYRTFRAAYTRKRPIKRPAVSQLHTKIYKS